MTDKAVLYYVSILGAIKVGEPAKVNLRNFGPYVTREVVSYDEVTETFETDLSLYVPAYKDLS
jgi:hypothetical protein